MQTAKVSVLHNGRDIVITNNLRKIYILRAFSKPLRKLGFRIIIFQVVKQSLLLTTNFTYIKTTEPS